MNARGILLFAHVLGLALWFGVTFTLALLTVRAGRTQNRDVIAFIYRGTCHLLKGPGLVGLLLTIGSGFGLIAAGGWGYFQPFPNHWLFQMQILGLIAAVLALALQLPNAGRLARAAEAAAAAGEESAAFQRFRKRNAIVSSVIGLLLLVSILLGTVRPGA
ncbi:MAG: DUF2269 family protein [Gemmatimonadota bacterium]|nr:DUF2269 family protein [Gemmatimonadota bacterium]